MNDTWFLAAGGPSLYNFDWSLLEDRKVIAVNRAFEKCPKARVVYFSDLRFWLEFKEALIKHPGALITGNSKIRCEKVSCWKFTGREGLETRYHHLKSGNNSGYAAINLAYHLGAKTIILLGYDMKLQGSRCHWHEPYTTVLKEDTLRKKMLPYFDALAYELKRQGVKVINTNLDSAIECFPKKPIAEVLNEY